MVLYLVIIWLTRNQALGNGPATSDALCKLSLLDSNDLDKYVAELGCKDDVQCAESALDDRILQFVAAQAHK